MSKLVPEITEWSPNKSVGEDKMGTSHSYTLIRCEERVTRGESDSYKIHNYITRDIVPRVSVAVSELRGELPGTMNTSSERIYYFVEAECTFTFHDGEKVKIGPGDSLYIPANTPYRADGYFTAVLVNVPAFSIDDEEQVAI